VRVTINGEERRVPDGATIADILRSLKVEEQVMAVAVNGEIVKREEWESYRPKEGDRIEFLTFVGGG